MKSSMRIATVFVVLLSAMMAMGQDIIVTNDGDTIRGFNIEIGPKTIFYQLSQEENAETKRIDKKDILIIRMADGTKVDPNATAEKVSNDTKKKNYLPRALREPLSHEPQTAKAISSEKKKGILIYTVKTSDEKTIFCRVVSQEERTMAITKGKYPESSYTLPEYVEADGVTYTVTEIDNKVFMDNYELTEITFPLMLKRIGDSSFQHCKIRKVILPEGIESLGNRAFFLCTGTTTRYGTIEEIYLPTSLKEIGHRCFAQSGAESSPGGSFQSRISCLPTFVTGSNCSSFGIDDRALNEYLDELKKME